MIRPLKKLVKKYPVVEANNNRPSTSNGTLNSLVIEVHAAPRNPSGKPRLMKLANTITISSNGTVRLTALADIVADIA
jgi:hypothetical protein